MAVSTDGQATRKGAGNRDEGEDHLRRSAGSAFALGSEHELRRANQPNLAAHENGRLVRKTLGYSKKLKMLRASSIWEDVLYNLGRALKTLRVESPESDGQRRWMGRSPAMAAGLTEHIWEIEELLTTLPLPSTNT